MLTGLCFATFGCKSKKHAIWSNLQAFYLALIGSHSQSMLLQPKVAQTYFAPPRVQDDVISSWALDAHSSLGPAPHVPVNLVLHGSPLILYIANSVGDSQATTCMWFYQKDHNNEEETLYCHGSSYV